ncbi:MAG TPA: DHA2 family efflux MFS transporter permease subunit [Solirubrobacteraceae bacterium]
MLAIASLGCAMAFIDATVVNIAFPNIEQSFKGTSLSTLSWVLNAYNIVFAAFLVPVGKLADLIGRKRIFIFGVELFTFASLLCAIAPSPALLIVFRAIQALGAACLVTAALAIVLNAFPPNQRSHGVALLGAVGAAFSGLGPSIGGVLIAIADWRLVFLVNIPVGIAVVILGRRRLVESRTPGRRRMPDILGALLFAVAIGALVLAVTQGQQWGWSSPRIIVSFAVAVVLTAVVVWRCSWHPSPMFELPLLRNRTFSVANTSTIIVGAGLYGYSLANVLFLTGVWHYSVLKAGLALTPGPFVTAATAQLSSAVVQRIGHRPVLVAGGLIWGGALLWLIERITVTPQYLSVFLPGVILLGIGTGTLFPNLTGAAVASAPGESYGSATGLNSVARQVGAALGVALVVTLIGTPSPLTVLAGFQHAWTFGAVCFFAAAIGSLFIGRVNEDRAPSLNNATRYILRHPTTDEPAPERPHSRRKLVLDQATAATPPGGQSTSEFLAVVPLFAGLEPELRERLAERTTTLRVPAGEWLFRAGGPGEAMYVVRTGRLEVVDEQTGAVVREVGRGEAVGELALLTGSPRSASVRAARSTDLVTIERAEFARLLEAAPAIALALNRVLAEELRDTRAAIPTTRPLPTTVVVAALDERVPVAEVGRALASELANHGRCVLLDGREVTPSDDAEVAAVYGPLLDRAEAGHDLVLLDAGRIASPTGWTDFCLQQADRILAVTAGGRLPEARQSRAELRGCDLVAYDITPGGGALDGWADTLDPVESHLVRGEKLDEDLARMARRLSGRSVGIVLSGGGARAFSHIGVLEELTGAGLAIDRVAGVSTGAYVGALFAMGLDIDEIDARCFDEWVQRRPLGDYTIPRHALIRGGRMDSMLQRTFGETAIEELPRSFMCGYTELRSGELVIGRTGPLWERVGFSMCPPILAPPAVRGEELFVDGSLVDNLPVTAMSDLGEGPVIAVDVKGAIADGSDGESPEAGGSSNGAGPTSPPTLGETLTRVLLLGRAKTSDAAARHADLVITPRPDGVGLLEFHQLDAAREAGRAAAREALESAPASSLA